MTPRQAAKVIGCSPQYIRDLIRAGSVDARKIRDKYVPGAYHYDISSKEVARIKAMPGRSTRGKRRKPNAQDS